MSQEVVTREEWVTARKALLREEKALMRYKDYVTAQRQALPWVKVEKDYTFESTQGERSLADLFADANQLIVYHFMFGPDWQAGCPGCTQVANTFALARKHLPNSDTRLVAVSRISVENISSFQAEQGWTFPWLSSLNSDFNFDFNASEGDALWQHQSQGYDRGETHGISVFCRNDAGIFHTYSCYERQVELYMVNLQYLDLVPGGR